MAVLKVNPPPNPNINQVYGGIVRNKGNYLQLFEILFNTGAEVKPVVDHYSIGCNLNLQVIRAYTEGMAVNTSNGYSDYLIRATAANGGIRAVAGITTNLTMVACDRHRLSKYAAQVLGQTMTAALLLAAGMKQPQARVSIRMTTGSDLGLVFADAGFDGSVRGYVANPEATAPLTADGFLQVIRDVGYGTPYSGNVELVSSEVSENITYYLVSSEQIPSALLTGVFINEQQTMVAGGLLLQIMPEARRNYELLQLLDERVQSMEAFSQLLMQGKKLDDIFIDLLGDIGLVILPEVQPVQFKCRCTFDRVLGALKMFGQSELRDMISQDAGAEATCQFCAEVYRASAADLEAIIHNLAVQEVNG